MKLSNKTVDVLKNFSTINQNLIIKEGNTLTTMSAMKNIVAKAEVEQTFPKEVAIYDLNEFLAALSLFTVPVLDFQDQFVMMSEEGSPKKSLKYFSQLHLFSVYLFKILCYIKTYVNYYSIFIFYII